MKRITSTIARPRILVLRLETLRIVGGADDPNLTAEPSKSSTAQSCTTSKFNCC